ncbi:MAG TPA: nucleoside deaminase [Candidatus Angelobacter sp.]|nr:nucleoside deaminase [Candidatus Angelobacter sp.]
MDQNDFIQQTIQLALDNVQNGGGPFGALIVKEGRVIATGVNQVTVGLDPTAHAEIVAIRKACQALQHFELTGCEIYCSCEPCPMCLGAIYWARPELVFFAAPGTAAADAGFDDTLIKQQICLPYQSQQLRISQLHHDQALAPFRAWKAKPDKIAY